MKRAAFALLTLGGAALAHAAPPPAFTARYQLALYGTPVGESVLSLSYTGGRYTMRSSTRAEGPAALLVRDRLEERAEGELGPDGPRPLAYAHRRSGGKDEESVRIAFDRARGEVRVDDDGQQAAFTLAGDMLDPLSLQLAVMWRLAEGRPLGAVTLVDDAEPERPTLAEQGRERVRTALGELEAIRLARDKPGGKRVTTFWFAPQFAYLPVQVTQLRKGREVLRMTLLAVEGLAR